MLKFLEVIPGVCISTRRIGSIEVQESKALSGDSDWVILIFSDFIENDKPITYTYNHQIFTNREAALAVAHKLVDRCGGGLYMTEVQA